MSLFRLSTEYLRKERKKRGTLAAPNLPAVNVADPVAPDLAEADVQKALNALTRYIPTEIVTLYIPAVSMLVENTAVTAPALYWLFGASTPFILVVVYQGQRKANGERLASLRQLPWWRMAASTIAFLVWALSVPGMPLPFISEAKGSTIIAGFSAIFVSVILNLFEPWFERLE